MPGRIEIKKEYTASQKSGELCIPNKELTMEFENALEDNDFGYVAELVKNFEEVQRNINAGLSG